MMLFSLSIFLSAFLLFQIQPMIGKFILPWFGGTPAVWSTADVVLSNNFNGRICICILACQTPEAGMDTYCTDWE